MSKSADANVQEFNDVKSILDGKSTEKPTEVSVSETRTSAEKSEFSAVKDLLDGKVEGVPKAELDNEFTKVKAALDSNMKPAIDPDALRPIDQSVRPVNPHSETEISDTYKQLQNQYDAIDSYFQSPIFQVMKEKDPVTARAQIDAASERIAMLNAKKESLNGVAAEYGEARLFNAALEAVPAWKSRSLMERESAEMLSFYEARGISENQLYMQVLNGQGRELYKQYKKGDVASNVESIGSVIDRVGKEQKRA